MGLITFGERRKNGDMIMTYNYDAGKVKLKQRYLNNCEHKKRRGYNKKLKVKRIDEDVKNYFFQTELSTQNSLPNNVCQKVRHFK